MIKDDVLYDGICYKQVTVRSERGMSRAIYVLTDNQSCMSQVRTRLDPCHALHLPS
jgi:hypothetical protein